MGLKIANIVPFETFVNLEFCKKSKCFIDTSIFLYKFLYGYKENWISGFFKMIADFKQYEITPVFIFDSKPPKEKLEVLQERKKKQTENTIKVTPEIIAELKEFLDSETIEYRMSPDYCDAEKYCCKLHLEEEDSYVMSNDYDTLLYGAKKTIRKIGNNYNLVILENLLTNNNLNFEQFTELCIGIGTDFNPKGIPGYGPKKCLKCLHSGEQLPMDIEEMNRIKDLFK